MRESILHKIKANIIQSLVGLCLFFILIFVKSHLFSKSIGSLTVITYISYLVAAVLLILYARKRFIKEPILPKFRIHNLLIKGYGFLLSAIMSLGLFYGLNYLFEPPGDMFKIKAVFNLATVLSVFIAVFIEELIFRYYMSGTLTGKKSDFYIYLITSSLAFSLLHAFSNNVYVLCYIFFYGIAFGMLYILTQNIGVPLGLHFANNYYITISADNNDVVYSPQSFSEVLKDNNIIVIIIAIVYLWWVCQYYLFKQARPKGKM